MIDKAIIKEGDTIEWSFKQKNKYVYLNKVGVVNDRQGTRAVKTNNGILWLVLDQPELTVSKIIGTTENTE